MKAIQSAEEFAYIIWDFNSESGEWPEYRDKIGAAIRSRDAAIIERLIEIVAEWNLRGYSGGILALDEKFYSVLSDLNGKSDGA